MVDLSLLPAPAVIEELDFEAIVARQKAKFQELWEAVRVTYPDLPAYDVAMLETDPAIILIEAESYREMLMRARANAAARSNLLAFSTGSDLDHLAADHGVTRLLNETDTALRSRIVLADQGRSAAGPEEWYKFHARSASIEVADVAVYKTGTGPGIEVAVLSTAEGGVPSSDLLTAVREVVTSPSIRSINDIVSVISATKTTINVAADVWLLPDAPASTFDALEAILRAALTSEGGIGFDVNRSWLMAKMMVAGVSKVDITSPAADVIMDDHAAATFGTIGLTYRGRMR